MFIDDFDFLPSSIWFIQSRNAVNHNWLDLDGIAVNHSLCIISQLCHKWSCCSKQAVLSLHTSECFCFAIIVGFDTFNIILKLVFRSKWNSRLDMIKIVDKEWVLSHLCHLCWEMHMCSTDQEPKMVQITREQLLRQSFQLPWRHVFSQVVLEAVGQTQIQYSAVTFCSSFF